MPSLLITRPRYETATHYLYYWSGLVAKEARKKLSKVFDLEKNKANKKNVESYLRKLKPNIVILNGHGAPSFITGQDDEPIIISGENTKLLEGSDVYMRACSAGQELGPDVIKSGAKSFIGYTEPFRFYTNEKEYMNKPLLDSYARPFFEASNQVVLSLIKGKTAKESHADSLNVYKKIISSLLNSNSENSFVIADLFWNMSHQVCYEK